MTPIKKNKIATTYGITDSQADELVRTVARARIGFGVYDKDILDAEIEDRKERLALTRPVWIDQGNNLE